MEKYKYTKDELRVIEKTAIPCAIYQFVDKRVVTLAVSDGFLKMTGIETREEAYRFLDEDMYRDLHPDDMMRVANAAVEFATGKSDYNLVYRSKVRGEYRVIHAIADHFYPEDENGPRLAVVWYVDEGSYSLSDDKVSSGEGEAGNSAGHEALNRIINTGLHKDTMVQELNYDFLTGLPSMTYFFSLAEEGRKKIRESGGEAAVVFMDLSGMKYFNEKYGFSEGDKLIKAFARLLTLHFSNENCSRFGQDHFAVFTEAEGIEAKLKVIFEEAKSINDGKSLPVKAGIYKDSMGIAETSLACDRAKFACDSNDDEYRSYYLVFNEEMLKREINRQYVVDNLDRAIEEGWIKAYYQPIVRTANGRVCEEEALSRWIDPVKGIMSPADFIPILEEYKLIYKVDLHMVDLILNRMKKQAELGLHVVPISVNLSRTDFEVCDIVEEIKKRVDAAGISRDLLTIEITESVIGDHFEYMKEQIERFRELGFQVWMDDFGSGYSSLDLLQDLKFDLLKFDMRFMRQFDNGEKSRIILTELIRMAIRLGIETVTEGVETAEQVEFLREVGCTKIQGFYYCKPLPDEEIFERYRKGIQIGFEDPRESAYFASIGRVNLYDLSVVTSGESESFKHYFDTLPMAVVETDGKTIDIIRCNRTFRDFIESYYDPLVIGRKAEISDTKDHAAYSFIQTIISCGEDGDKAFVDESVGINETAHAFVRRLAVNPVSGIAACAVVVLGITPDQSGEISFAHVASALSSDYIDLYYVNLKTEQYIQYSPDAASQNLSVEHRGEDFFAASRRDALKYLHEGDRDAFIKAFTKENVIKILDEYGAFTKSYRLLMNGRYLYANTKVVRMVDDPDHIIVGVNNVDAEIRQREMLERVRQESMTFERISALVGNVISMYTIDPETEEYVIYNSTEKFDKLSLPTEGVGFFASSRDEIERVIHKDDLEPFLSSFTKENVMKTIEEKGAYELEYRLMMDGTPVRVCLRAAIIEERDGTRLVIGVNTME